MNHLNLRCKLHSLRLKDGESIQDHVKTIMETFNELLIVGDAITDEDRVVYLLASLPESFNTLVTTLESNPSVPAMEMVIERLMHEERKLKDCEMPTESVSDKALIAKQKFESRGPIAMDAKDMDTSGETVLKMCIHHLHLGPLNTEIQSERGRRLFT